MSELPPTSEPVEPRPQGSEPAAGTEPTAPVESGQSTVPTLPPQPEARPPAPPPSGSPEVGRRTPVGRLAVGVVLLGIGVVWLLQAVGAIDVSFVIVLPVALVLIGLVILAAPGRHGGLIALGIILSLILAVASGFDVKLQGGVGNDVQRPSTVAELQRTYHLSVGQLTIDLTGLRLGPGTYRLDATVGMGQLTVRVPPASVVHLHGHSGAGQVSAFGRQESGVDATLDTTSPAAGGTAGAPVLYLDLRVGLGQIEVSG